jgi:hypothetical protein
LFLYEVIENWVIKYGVTLEIGMAYLFDLMTLLVYNLMNIYNL